MPWKTKIRAYRERAEELRTIAEDFSDENVQRMLAKLAADYELMAEGLERATPRTRCTEPRRSTRPA